jgi:hypothetical protein
MQHPDWSVSSRAGVALHEMGAALTGLLQTDKRFPGEEIKMIRDEHGMGGFYPAFAGTALARRAVQTGDPTEAIAWLERVLKTSKASGHSITALWGVPVERRGQLVEGVEILPINDLPDSTQKRRLMSGIHGLDSMIASWLNHEPPSSALVMRLQVDPVICAPDYNLAEGNKDFLAAGKLIDEITLCLTVVGPRVPLQAAHWFTFDDPDIESANLMSGSRSHRMVEILPGTYRQYPPLDIDDAAALVRGYLGLHDETRNKIRVALQRLNQAQRRHNLGDCAVELAIALEALTGDSDNSEMTHKVTVRSVRLLGGEAEQREKNRQIIQETYGIRSTLVHTGEVRHKNRNIGGVQVPPQQIVDQATLICVDLIKHFIHRGSIPRWPEFDVNEQVG